MVRLMPAALASWRTCLLSLALAMPTVGASMPNSVGVFPGLAAFICWNM